jgi:S-adenosylmethionine:tRNA ribosyltransferase-isomerase
MRLASEPIQRPENARVLEVDRDGAFHHTPRSRLAERLEPGDVLVANDAATIPASLHGVHARTRGLVEIRLAGRPSLEPKDVYAFTAVAFGEGDHLTRTEHRAAPPPLSPGDLLLLGPLTAIVTAVDDLHPRLATVSFRGSPDLVWRGIARHGAPIQYAHVPEQLRMWDVWTRVAGVPAAFESPSAGFLLDWGVLRRLRERGIDFVTLTHAAGISSTGDPALDACLPFDEAYRIPETTAAAVAAARARGGRVVALGTTVTRALEHAASSAGGVRAGDGVATQRIGPNTRLRVVDAIVSGAHEAGESHYQLLRAFADDHVLEAMSRALDARGYRTHEFGDSVLVSAMRSAVTTTRAFRRELVGVP